MRAHRRKIDHETVSDWTSLGQDRLESLVKLATACLRDEEKSKRRKSGLCKLCHYEPSRIGGCGVTYAQCGLCDEMVSSGTGNIDVLCQSCAVANGLCKHCGADLEFVNRRKRVLPKPTPDWPEEE